MYQHQNLRWLNLVGNKMEGGLQDSFNLPALEVLLIQNNNWTGSLPSSLGNSTNLIKLQLSQSDDYLSYSGWTGGLTGGIPESNFTQIKHFFVGNQNLGGSGYQIPGFIFDSWSKDPRSGLRDFRIEGNNFEGTVPAELGDFNLLTFSIKNNNFSGSLPARIASGMKDVIIFEVRHNNLTGNFPNGEMIDGEWKGWRTKTRLRTFNIGDNNFTGPLPDMPEYVGDMSVLILSDNNFEGTIPDTWEEAFHTFFKR
ncbi:hypothetical protein [Rhodohalobacter sp.]|uniref:hypothetical protein n=1 Tax=Rhodohalobacter sp. TaxID=1974210 RepID=UPI002ACE37E2|nr:hypothetical protein [Rhodohalobacter sp.]MDZ7755194.1 hypothetical protein [Rhodohalobacter sp.]